MAAADDPVIVKALIERGADVNAVDQNGWSAICYALHEINRRN